MADKDELKPCPFCGKEAQLDKDSYGYYEVGCYNYGCQVQPFTEIFDTKREAIRAWNRRAKNVR